MPLNRYKGWKHEGITGWLWNLAEKLSSRTSVWVWQQRWGKRPTNKPPRKFSPTDYMTK